MSSFSESNAPMDFNGHDYNQRPGRRSLRESFERQPSDKHLKRRNQLLQLQNKNGNSNRQFLYQDPLATISSSASVSEQSQYEWHKGHDRSDVFARYRNRKSTAVLLVVLCLLVVATLWYSSTTISTTPGIMMGGKGGSDSEDSGSGDSLRSYQDLADSIRSLRKRRQAKRDEVMGEGHTITNDDDREVIDSHEDVGNNFHEQDQDVQLKRLEEKIQRDQTEKVKHEFLLSKNDKSPESKDDAIHDVRKNALNNKHMADNIEALKLFNDHNNKKVA